MTLAMYIAFGCEVLGLIFVILLPYLFPLYPRKRKQ